MLKREWSGPDWYIAFDGNNLNLNCGDFYQVITIDDVAELKISGIVNRTLKLRGKKIIKLKGIKKQTAREIIIIPQIAGALNWEQKVNTTISEHIKNGRWVSTEVVESMLTYRPSDQLKRAATSTNIENMINKDQITELTKAMEDLQVRVQRVNQGILKSEKEELRSFFSSIETKQLTLEQIEAVVCYDKRVQVIASAGSGKTSVMVARAAYSIKKGFVKPERILMLAYNKAAAAELSERVKRRLETVGLDPSGINVSTFHAFGLATLGKATGKKPRLAPWLDQANGDLREINNIVIELKSKSKDFSYKWDIFRLLFANNGETEEDNEKDGYDSKNRQRGHNTLDGKTVRSFGEKKIADALFLHGVIYEYEKPYKYDTATSSKSQYRPDFYYPQIELWHEHIAVNSRGEVLPGLESYKESLQWKRETHKKYKTELYETTYHDVIHEDGIDLLLSELESKGIRLNFDPSKAPIEHAVSNEEIIRTIRTFMSHVKSSGLSKDILEERLSNKWKRLGTKRTKRFLEIYWIIHDTWEKRLKENKLVDYDDMILLASKAIELKTYVNEYDLVLIDEFQDISIGRAKMARALIDRPETYLLTVGDDWQAINRFAGADISIMKNFNDWFGISQIIKLTTTFRCPQTICEATSKFISKNPNQISKIVNSCKQNGKKVLIKKVNNSASGLNIYLTDLSKRIELEESGVKPTVLVLGRYNFDQALMPTKIPQNLKVTFSTIHSAKGLEADYVVILRINKGLYGFPSRIKDDPVLALVSIEAEDYRHAEERRLLYVAMTRAKVEVTLISEEGKESEFITELLSDGLCMEKVTPGEKKTEICLACEIGTIVKRKGPYGTFNSCSRFPECTGK